jgi:glycerol-3-phosphate acyltransferase PlsY
MTTQFWFALAAAYLLGSIPFASIAAHHLRGVDIRNLGDHNPGGKNVFEQIDPIAGGIVVLLDMGKGVVAVWLARTLGLRDLTLLWIGYAAVVGHNWSIFLHWQGGQGMATTVGVLLSLLPTETLLAILVIALVLLLTRNWNLACGIGMFTLLVFEWWTSRPADLVFYTILLLLLIGIRKWMQRVRAELKSNQVQLPVSR